MKYIKTRQHFVFEKKNFDRIEISKSYGNSVIVKEALNNDITWGGSLLGRLFSSIGRKLRIEYNKFKVNGLVQQLQDELLNLCAEYKKDIIEDDDDYGPVVVNYLLQQIEDEVKDTSRNDDQSKERLVDKGMIDDTISWIENEIDESVLPKKDEVIKRLKNFKRRLSKLSGPGDPKSQDFLDKSVNLLKAFRGLLGRRKTIKLVGGPSGGSVGGGGPQVNDEFYVKDDSHNLYGNKVKIVKVLAGNKFVVTPAVGGGPNFPNNPTLELTQLLRADGDKGKVFSQYLNQNGNASTNDKKIKFKQILQDATINESYFDFASYLLITEATPNLFEINHSQNKEEYNIWKRISAAIKENEEDSTIKNKIDKIDGFVRDTDANKKTIKMIGALMSMWYRKNKGDNAKIPPYLELIKDEYAQTKDTPYGKIDLESYNLFKYMASVVKFIVKIDFEPSGGNKLDFGDKVTKNLKSIKSSVLELSKIWGDLGDEDGRKDMINERLYNKIYEYADANGKVKQIWDEEIGNNKDDYTIDESKLKAFKERNEKRVEEETTIGLDRDRLVRIVRIFGEAHRLYCWDYIPSNRPGMVVSGMTLREYRKVGKGDNSRMDVNTERGGGIQPGYGPWINLRIYEDWERGVMDMVERPDVKKLLSSMLVKNEAGGKGRKERYSGDDDDSDVKTKAYERTTLFSFIQEMITISDSPDYYRERRRVISKHFLGDLNSSDIGDREITPPTPPSGGDDESDPKDENVCSWYKPGLIEPPLSVGGSWNNHINDWKGKFFYWFVEDIKTSSVRHIHGYIMGEKNDYVVIRFDMSGERKKLGKFVRSNVDSPPYTFDSTVESGDGGQKCVGIFRKTSRIDFNSNTVKLEIAYTDPGLTGQKQNLELKLKGTENSFVLSSLPKGGKKQKAVPIKSNPGFKSMDEIVNKLK